MWIQSTLFFSSCSFSLSGESSATFIPQSVRVSSLNLTGRRFTDGSDFYPSMCGIFNTRRKCGTPSRRYQPTALSKGLWIAGRQISIRPLSTKNSITVLCCLLLFFLVHLSNMLIRGNLRGATLMTKPSCLTCFLVFCFTAEIWLCHSRKSISETHFVNDGSVPLSAWKSGGSEPACITRWLFLARLPTCLEKKRENLKKKPIFIYKREAAFNLSLC